MQQFATLIVYSGYHHSARKYSPKLEKYQNNTLICCNFLNNIVATNVLFPPPRWEEGLKPSGSGRDWDRDRQEENSHREEREEVSSEVVFTCHNNVGQSPAENPQIARVVNRLHLSQLI